ncbi:hypothetical protein FACS189437_08830 [Bacteroidia bacterium]|nr:hypothetical protein FACS189437_08830 [Bacteroidia bacterium]
MKKMMILMLTLLIWGSASMNAQVTIGSDKAPHAGAVLDLESTTQGFKLPTVALTTDTQYQLAGDSTTAVGMVVFNNNSAVISAGTYVWDGSKWVRMGMERAIDGPVVIGDSATYRTLIYPGEVGTWWRDNSREGTPTYNYYENDPSLPARGHYYNWTAASTACPAGWHVPTVPEAQALRDWLNRNDIQGNLGYYCNLTVLVGYRHATGGWQMWGKESWLRLSPGGFINSGIGSTIQVVTSVAGNAALPIRCKQD